MSSVIIDGQAVAAKARAEIAEKVAEFKAVCGKVPGIAVVLAGDDPASAIYVANKEKAALSAGMYSRALRLSAAVAEEELLAIVDELNKDDQIHGILVQLPLPKRINASKILSAISPSKDVDGFHPINVGKLHIGEETFVSCTPLGIMRLLKEYNVEPSGKQAVVVGRSNIVGKPVSALLLQANATVTVCHSKTEDLPAVCRQADILVAAIGKAKMITAEYVKRGAVVIDVGMNRIDGKLCGDVDFENVLGIASAITPVPKGVGPMTIAMLMNNTLQSFIKSVRM